MENAARTLVCEKQFTSTINLFLKWLQLIFGDAFYRIYLFRPFNLIPKYWKGLPVK